MLMKEKVRSINVGGTRTLLNACIKQGVVGFIYTSSANVIFSGRKELADVAEDLPYNTEEECVDEYSRTKRMAEMLTLEYNGKKLDQENPILFEELAPLDGKSAASSSPKSDDADPNSEFVGASLFLNRHLFSIGLLLTFRDRSILRAIPSTEILGRLKNR